MGKDTNISWTHHTANFWWGCQKVSPGCKNCYADTYSKRLGKDIWGPPATTTREVKKAIWHNIQKWDYEAEKAGERRRVFVQSMSDFLEDHPMVHEWRESAKVFLAGCKNLDIQMLTKRPENAPLFLADWYESWPKHIWMGTSVENQEQADKRIPQLLKIPAPVRFLSVEPMLEPINILGYLLKDLHKWDRKIHWVIAGGESGAGYRELNIDGVWWLHDQCRDAGTAFFVKQDSGLFPGRQGRIPDALFIQEFPKTERRPL